MKDIKRLQWFRQKLYELLPRRRDATLDLIDALSSDVHSESVTQLSLSPVFRREYNSITKVIKDFLHHFKPVNDNGIIRRISSLCQEAMYSMSYLLSSLCDPPESKDFFCLVSMQPLDYDPMRGL